MYNAKKLNAQNNDSHEHKNVDIIDNVMLLYAKIEWCNTLYLRY